MRESQEIVTASRMQNIVQIWKENCYFVIVFLILTFRALGVDSPRGGAITNAILKGNFKQYLKGNLKRNLNKVTPTRNLKKELTTVT